MPDNYTSLLPQVTTLDEILGNKTIDGIKTTVRIDRSLITGGASEADVEAVDERVDAVEARTLTAAGLATGGGDLSASRTITVPKASGSDVLTGTDDAKAVTALALASAVGPGGRVGIKGSDIASSSTVDLSTATGDYVNITGTTTITALGTMPAGIRRTLRFAGILTLTHNATSLILPGAANITTAAGDVASFVSLGSGNWQCVGFMKASGAPVGLNKATPAVVLAGTNDTDYTTALGVKAGLDSRAITSGEMYPLRAAPNATAVATSTVIVDAYGNNAGISIASGAASPYGASSAVYGYIVPPSGWVALLTGCTIKLKMKLTATVGFLTDHPLGGAIASVQRGATTVSVGELTRSEQPVGSTEIFREATYVVTATDTAFGMIAQLAASGQAGGTLHTMQIDSLSFEVVALAANKTYTATDLAALLQINAATATVEANTRTTMGEQVGDPSLFRPNGSAGTGATATTDANGYMDGFTVTAGQTGANSNVQGLMFPTAAEIVALTGATVRMKMELSVPAGLMSVVTPGGAIGTAVRGLTTAGVGFNVDRRQVGTALYIEVDYVVTSADTGFGPVFQIGGSSAAISGGGTIRIVSATWEVISWPAASATSRGDRTLKLRNDRREAAIKASTKATLRDQYAFVLGAGAASNGASVSTIDGRILAMSIPSGSTGASTYLRPEFVLTNFPTLIQALRGATVRVRTIWNVSVNFEIHKKPTGTMLQKRAYNATALGGSPTTASISDAFSRQVGTKLYRDCTYVIGATDVALLPLLQVASSGTVDTADHSASLQSMVVDVLAWPTVSGASDTDRALALIKGLATRYKARKIGSGYDYADLLAVYGTSPTGNNGDTNGSITDALPTNPYVLTLTSGVYTTANSVTIDDVDLVGARLDTSVIRVFNPDDTDPLTGSSQTQGLWHEGDGVVHGVTVEVKNARYAIHNDPNTRKRDRRNVIRSSRLIHLGNLGVRTYQAANGNPGLTNVWAATVAHGMGVDSGTVVDLVNVLSIGEVGGASYHTRGLFEKPSRITYRDGVYGGTNDDAFAINIQANGSRVVDECEIVGCTLRGDITYNPTPWQTTDTSYRPSSRAEIQVYGHGNTPAVFRVTDTTERGLRIQSATTGASSTVAISGTAGTILFGSMADIKAGDVGLAGRAIGDIDVAAQQTMGQLLGDCSSVSKTLTVTVDGGSAINIVFSTNMTAVSNATVLGTINTALSTAATASLDWVTGRYRAAFRDEERLPKNGSASAIPRGSVVAWDGSCDKVRLMTSADAVSLFAGVAIEDIYIGSLGRIKARGWLSAASAAGDVIRTDSATGDAFGSTFSIDAAAPGKIYRGGSQGLLPIVRLANGLNPTALEVGR